jgi:transposase-like protein
MKKLTPMEQLSQRAADLRQSIDVRDLTGELIRLGAQRLIQELLEAEVSQALGRERYERGGSDSPPNPGYRNGHKARRIKTAEGTVPVQLPQVRDSEDVGGFRSTLWPAIKGQGQGRTGLLERLVVEMYARGLSTRDIEDALGEWSGRRDQDASPLLARSSVSRVTEVLWEEYEQFARRDLGGFDLVYLFTDAVYESLARAAKFKQAVLVSWGILSDGSKVLLHISLGNKEKYEHWLDHFRSLKKRNLPCPLTVTTDGAPGQLRAVAESWPEAERLRCWVHKMRNVLDKVPDDAREPVKADLVAVREASDYDTGKRRAAEFCDKYRRVHPSAVASFEDDLEASLAHLKLPPVHRKHVRSTNLAERGFEEHRRRSKVIPCFGGERECLKLVYATLLRCSARWCKVKFTKLQVKQLEEYIARRKAEGRKIRTLFVAA